MSPFYFPAPQHIPLYQRYHSITENWEFSMRSLMEIRQRLHEAFKEPNFMIAVAGSLGRLEASPQSDLDFIIVSTGECDTSSVRARVSGLIKDLGFALPKADGVFSEASTLDLLLEGVGSHEENLGHLARRMLLLLESQPILNDELYLEVVGKVFERYAGDVRKENHKQFAFLMNDLIRYFRSICVNYQSTFWRENEKWPLRNLKLRHSRVIMYVGLLFLLGHASRVSGSDRVDFVKKNLNLTPLDRIALVYKESNDDGYFRIAGLYEVFLSAISDEKTRTTLKALEYENRYSDPTFSRLKANSDALIAELMRFLWSRKGDWSDRFFEYLLF
jgi:predicted nucleotidyltransferase